MAVIIKDRRVATDTWQLLKAGPDGALPPVPPAGDVIVPLAFWRGHGDALLAREGRLGVWLDSHEDPALVVNDSRHFALIAVNFPKMGDGRGHSIARLLRERHGWQGELRAIGYVIRDLLFDLSRCGFDAFSLREGEDLQAALSAFNDFSEGYQTSVERPLPLFRRRGAAKFGTAA
jgi:uncharacterized protein (DUF934 family)